MGIEEYLEHCGNKDLLSIKESSTNYEETWITGNIVYQKKQKV